MVITVTIDPTRFDNPIHQSMYVLGRLIDAGVPVTGTLGVTGVVHGTLSIGPPDLATGEAAYVWAREET